MRLLVVEDQEPLRRQIERFAERWGWEAVGVEDVRTAVRELSTQRFDCLLLDLVLPEISGSALYRQLIARADMPPIVVMSGDAPIARHLGVPPDRFLLKPFQPESLRQAVLEAASRGAPEAPTLESERDEAPRDGADRDDAERDDAERRRAALAAVRHRLDDPEFELPVLDRSLLRLKDLRRRSEIDLEEVRGHFEGDPAIVTAVLRRANSAAIRGQGSASSFANACVRLGADELLSIGLEVALRSAFKVRREPFATQIVDIWRNAVVTARIAAHVNERLKLGVDDAHTVGLLHNVGELAVLHALSETNLDLATPDTGVVVERAHQRIGAELLARWELPRPVVTVAGRHHGSRLLDARLVVASWRYALGLGFGYLQLPDAADDAFDAGIVELGGDAALLDELRLTPWK